jgi:hypothetical protein
MPEIIHAPHPGAQEAFLSSNVDDLFIGGEKGNGKSWLLLQEVLYDVDEENGNAILFRRTYKDLTDLWNKAHQHYSGYAPHYKEDKHEIIFPSGFRFTMSHLQHPKDVFNHTGQEYHLIMFDELPNFPKFVPDFMRSCLRTVNPRLKTRTRSTGNPVGEGKAHVKARYINALEPDEIGWFTKVNDRDVRASKELESELLEVSRLSLEEKIIAYNENPELVKYKSRQWMKGIRKENTTLMKADPGYEGTLDNLPENLKKAFKHGIWDDSDKNQQVVLTKHWENALAGNEVLESPYAYIGADYALSGDKCVICSGRGNKLQRFVEFDGMDHKDFADEIEKEMARYGKYQVITAVDANGIGSGVYTELLRRGHVNLFPCMYKDHSFEPKINKPDIVKLKFDNFRSMACWKLRESFQYKEIDLSELTQLTDNDGLISGFYYDNLHMLEEEVLFFTYDQVGDKIVILSKKEGKKVQLSNGEPGLGRSSDRFDALMYWNWVRGRKPSLPPKMPATEGADYGIQEFRNQNKPKKRSAYI